MRTALRSTACWLLLWGLVVALWACDEGDSGDSEPEPLVCDPGLVSIEPILAGLRGLDIDAFFEESYKQMLLRNPEKVTADGLSSLLGIRDDKLNNISFAYRDQTYELIAGIRSMLQGYDRSALSPEQQLSYDIYLWSLDDALRDQEFARHHYPASHQISSLQNDLVLFFRDIHPVTDLRTAEDYVARLGQVGGKLACLNENIAACRDAGVVPLRFMLEIAADQVRAVQPGTGLTLPFYTAFNEKLQAAAGLTEDQKTKLLEQAEDAVEQSVIPGYQALLQTIEALIPSAPEDGGVWRLPDGDRFYAHLLRHHTTTEMTADEIHQLGLDEVARIQEEIRAAFDLLGYPEDQGLTELFARVAVDGGTVAQQDVVATYEEIIANAEQNLDAAFDIFAAIDVIVIGGETGGYYVAGASDGSRPGAFYAYAMSDLPWYDMSTLAHHEAVPGHHTQIAISQGLDLPLFRTVGDFTAYAEGWALYAELLAKELGWYDDDVYSDLGRLQFELYRAVRLVVDTGLHALHWSFAEAADYMAENTGFSDGEAEWQIARYLTMPGQATAYKIGMLKILELRKQATDALGEQFDLKAFHRVVLQSGWVPLPILEQLVQDYLERQ